MEQQGPSRRSFVGGAVVSAAVIGAVGFVARRKMPGRADGIYDGIEVVEGGATAYRPIPHEVDHWQSAIGRPVRVAAENGNASGTILSVVPGPLEPKRPAGLRRQSFLVYLAMDRQGAPKGDRIYALTTPIAGLTRVFLTRGDDVAGKAILMALFN